MDSGELSRLGEFSSTLTHVLSELEKKVREGNSGNSKLIALASTIEKHAAAIKNLEQAREDQKGSLDEALIAHAQMGRNVMDLTSQQCTDIQSTLVDLRNDTKRDLGSMQGTLQVTFQESLEALLLRIGPPPSAEFPTITSDMAPDEVLRIMHGRMQNLECKFQSQEVINEGLRAALATDRNTQDRFDEVTSRMVKMERGMEAQNKRLAKTEKQVEALRNSQSKMEKIIMLMDQKINAVACGGGGDLAALGPPLDTAAMFAQVEATTTEVVASTTPDIESQEEDVYVKKAPSAKRGPRVSGILSERLHKQRPARVESGCAAEVDETVLSAFPSEDTLDSRELVDEYMLERIDVLDGKVSDDLQQKIATLEENDQRLQSTVKALQDAVKDLEKAAEEAKDHPVTVEYDHASQMAKVFKGITYEAKDGWERAFDELDKKVARMDYITAQNGEKADEYHQRLASFRNQMEKALVEMEESIAALKEAEEKNTPDVKDSVLMRLSPLLECLILESVSVADIERSNKATYDKKPPGTAVPISQMPSKLPDNLTAAVKKTNTFLDEGISKIAMKKRADTMQEEINDRVISSMFQKLEDDMKIALTLKADSKALETMNVKKASCLELQKFREHVADEIDGMREMLVKNAANATKMLQSMSSTGGDNGELNRRFDLLYSQFQDIQRGVAAFVPRSEIEIALQALLDEVKTIQRTTVDKDVLMERLKKKADRGDVERLLALLSGTVGDPQNGFAAATHKCLVCDKPSNPFNVDDDNMSPPKRPNQSATLRGDRTSSPNQFNRPQTSQAALGRPQGRQTAEVNILRNSMESLPPVVNPATALSNERESSVLTKHRQVQKRIRATAGGGVG